MFLILYLRETKISAKLKTLFSGF